MAANVWCARRVGSSFGRIRQWASPSSCCRRAESCWPAVLAGAYRGDWCVPCGYVEYDEDVREAARREFREETGLLVEVGGVYAVHSNFHDPAAHTVGIWFLGEVLEGTLQAADDVDQVAWVALHEVPDNLAFPTDRLVIRQLQRQYGTAKG